MIAWHEFHDETRSFVVSFSYCEKCELNMEEKVSLNFVLDFKIEDLRRA
jgi:hypothetical protein